MIDHIFKIKEFKKRVMKNKTFDLSELRICVEKEPIDEMSIYSRITFILTIPDHEKRDIISCVVARKTFSSFHKDKDTEENKEYVDWYNSNVALINKHFNFKIIDGKWLNG